MGHTGQAHGRRGGSCWSCTRMGQGRGTFEGPFQLYFLQTYKIWKHFHTLILVWLCQVWLLNVAIYEKIRSSHVMRYTDIQNVHLCGRAKCKSLRMLSITEFIFRRVLKICKNYSKAWNISWHSLLIESFFEFTAHDIILHTGLAKAPAWTVLMP